MTAIGALSDVVGVDTSVDCASVERVFDPWHSLGALSHVTLVWHPLAGRYGSTDGRATIWMHPRQTRVEKRCTLTHELIHLERGHTSACHSAVERAVRAETARRLMHIDDLVDAYRWAMSFDEIAEECDVTRTVLFDRLGNLRPREAQELADALLRRDLTP